MTNNNFHFAGGNSGAWKIVTMNTVCGLSLEQVPNLHIFESKSDAPNSTVWTLTGFTSNTRYAEKKEQEQLKAIQAALGRPEATCAALIPIRKTEAWWMMAQDERRKIFETDSHHTATGLQYLPAIARKLYHCRDLGEPFDFLTWFEYASHHTDAFEELVYKLRQTEEWKFIDREIDIRLVKNEHA
jgi:chlorite dismutase